MQTDFFKSIELFSQASPESLELLSNSAERVSYKKSSIILAQHQSSAVFLYLINGWIKLYKESAEGAEIVVDILSQENYCGESFLFEEKTEEVYTAQSISDVDIITVPIQFLKQLMLEDHSLSLSFLQAALQKQQQLNMQLEHLSIQTAAQRIGCFILRSCDNPISEESVTLQLPYDKLILASRLGMRPETFSRALGALSEQCDLRIDGENICIPKISNLSQYVCQHCSKIFPCNMPQ